jgi:Uma2 family endonuclease
VLNWKGQAPWVSQMDVITPIAPVSNLQVVDVQAIDVQTIVSALPNRKRFTLAEYHWLTEIGFWGEDDRVELIYGELVEMVAKNAAHIFCCQRLLKQLPRCLGEEMLQCQDPIILPSASEPEPDFAILSSDLSGKATADQVLLVIEIADSSLNDDRTVKGPLYAEARIPHYWIFNVLDRQVECLSQPQQNSQGVWGYSLQQIVLPNQAVALPQPLQGAIDLTQTFASVPQSNSQSDVQ